MIGKQDRSQRDLFVAGDIEQFIPVGGKGKGTKSGKGGSVGLESVLWMYKLPAYEKSP